MNIDFEKRKNERLQIERAGLLALKPDGPLFPCMITEISDAGASINVGALVLPETFVLILSQNGDVRRICKLVWHHDEAAQVRFITAARLIHDSLSPVLGHED